MKKRTTTAKSIRTLLLAAGLTLLPAFVIAQQGEQLTPEDCYALARQNYPLAKQLDLINKSRDYSLENASKGYLPQVGIYGQATYQSDVTKISVPIPNLTIPSPDKDQYKLYGEVTQPLTDLLVIKTQKELYEANAGIQAQSLEVELYKLRDRINQLYFGILLAQEQLAQNELLIKDLNTSVERMRASVTNGVATSTNLYELQAEVVKAQQRKLELGSMVTAYSNMLGLFINKTLDEKVTLKKPEPKAASMNVARPELNLFERQKKAYDYQDKLLLAKATPRVSLFFQAGYGKPAFNMFSNDFDFYYIGGARLSWSLTTFYTLKKDRELLNINREMIDLQSQSFLLNTNTTLKQQDQEIARYTSLIKSDGDLVELRTKVKEAASAQLSNGTITTTDYLSKVNAEDQAKQNLIIHQVQLLLAEYNYQSTSGN